MKEWKEWLDGCMNGRMHDGINEKMKEWMDKGMNKSYKCNAT